MPPLRLITLVRCEPYRARLQASSCVARYKLAMAAAQSKRGPNGTLAIQRSKTLRDLVHCVDCPVGCERALGATLEILGTRAQAETDG